LYHGIGAVVSAVIEWVKRLVLAALFAFAQETDPPIPLPFTGGGAESAVRDALAKVEGVGHVAVKSSSAQVAMKCGVALSLEEAGKALAGVSCKPDEAIAASWASYFATKEPPTAEALKKALSGLKGFKSARPEGSGFRAVFDGAEQATIADVRKATGATNVFLAPAKDGARYICLTHPEIAHLAEVRCPRCGVTLSKELA